MRWYTMHHTSEGEMEWLKLRKILCLGVTRGVYQMIGESI